MSKAENLAKQVGKLSTAEHVEFLLQYLPTLFGGDEVAIIQDLLGHARTAPDGPLLRFLIALREKQEIDKDAFAAFMTSIDVRALLPENPNLPPDLVDWLLDIQHYGIMNPDKSVAPMTEAQRLRALKELRPDYIEQWVATYHSDLADDAFEDYFVRWMEKRTHTKFREHRTHNLHDCAPHLVFDGDWPKKVRDIVAVTHRRVSDDALRKFWSLLGSYDQKSLASHPHLPPDVITEFLTHPPDEKDWERRTWNEIRDLFLVNPNTPEEFMWFYQSDTAHWPLLIQNPSLPEQLRDLMLSAGDDYVQVMALKNPNLPVGLWRKVLMQLIDLKAYMLKSHLQDSGLRKVFLNDERMTETIAMMLFDLEFDSKKPPNNYRAGDMALAYFTAPPVTPEKQVILIEWLQAFEFHKAVYLELLRDLDKAEQLTAEVVAAIAERTKGGGSDADSIREFLAKDSRTPLSVLRKFAKLSNYSLSGQAMGRLRDLEAAKT